MLIVGSAEISSLYFCSSPVRVCGAGPELDADGFVNTPPPPTPSPPKGATQSARLLTRIAITSVAVRVLVEEFLVIPLTFPFC